MSTSKSLEHALTYHRQGQVDLALNAYKEIITKEPNNVNAIQLYGALCLDIGKYELAESLLARAISLMPNQLAFHVNIALAKDRQKKFKEAERHYKKALSIEPNNSQALFAYARSLENQNDLLKAQRLYEKLLKSEPNNEHGILNLSSVYNLQNNSKEAEQLLKRLIEINPKHAKAYNNLGNILRNTNYDLAVDYFYKSLKIDPTLSAAALNLYMSAGNILDWEKQFFAKEKLVQTSTAMNPMMFLSDCQDLELCKNNAAFFAPQVNKNNTFSHHRDNKQRNRKIKVAYISGDFFNHPTSHLMRAMLKEHNNDIFHITIYSYSKNDQSKYYLDIKNSCEEYIDISNMSNYDVAQIIYKDNIDILIDLKGHTLNSRMEVLAYKPAPIQAHFLGFPGTTGAQYIDYYIGDQIITPLSMQPYFTEKIVNLPHCYQPNEYLDDVENISRQEYDLPSDGFIFASFNQQYKISEECFSMWMEILKQTSNTYLWILAGTDKTKENIIKKASKYGIEQKLIFAKGTDKTSHLARLRLADLALDTINYNGHTTTSDCLFAGLPVLTIQGNHTASRVSSSILNEFNLNSLITRNKDEYISTAKDIVKNNKANEFKAHIKNIINQRTIPMLNPPAFTESLEKLFLQIFDEYTNNNI